MRETSPNGQPAKLPGSAEADEAVIFTLPLKTETTSEILK